MRFTQLEISDQRTVLRKLAELTARSLEHPAVRKAATAITQDCDARDDMCELQAIFDAVKSGSPHVRGLENGFRYVSDPKSTDYFLAAYRSLENCEQGSCGGDCDDHSVLVAALAGSIGFTVGLRAWGRPGKDYEHVYAVVMLYDGGKHSRSAASRKSVIALDTTVPEFSLGDEPPKGRVLTAWLEDT